MKSRPLFIYVIPALVLLIIFLIYLLPSPKITSKSTVKKEPEKKEDKKEEKEPEKKDEREEVKEPKKVKVTYNKVPDVHIKVKRIYKEDKVVKKQRKIVQKQEELQEKLPQKYKQDQELAIEVQKDAIKKAEQAKELAKRMNELKEEQKKLKREKEKKEKQRLGKEPEKKDEKEAEARSKEAELLREKEEKAKREQEEAKQRFREEQQKLLKAQEEARQKQQRLADKLKQDRLTKEAEEAERIAREQQVLVDEQKEAERIAAEQQALADKLSVDVPDKDTMSREELKRKNEKGKKVRLKYDFVLTGWSFEEFYRFAEKREVKILFISNKIEAENFEVTGLRNGKPDVRMRRWDGNNYSNKGGIVAEIPTEGKHYWNKNDTYLREVHRAKGFKMAFFFPYYFFSDLVDLAEKHYEAYKKEPGIPYSKGAGTVKFTITKDYKFDILKMGNTREERGENQ